MSDIKNPITKLVQKEINDYNNNSFSGGKKFTASEIKDRTETHIHEILKTCSELGAFYTILKGLLCGVYDMSDKDKMSLPESIKELFILYDEKLSFVAYESVTCVYKELPDEVESEQ
jgi:hypothetical protein